MLGLIFWVGKQVPVADTRRALYFGWENRYQWQVYVALYILGGKTGTSGKYTLRLMFWVGNKVPATSQVSGMYMLAFIFWVGKQVLATGQVPRTSQASYFR